MTSAVTVLLHTARDPEVFDFETGKEISKHCDSIRIISGQKAIARMLKVNKDGSHYISSLTQSIAVYFVQVLSISGYGMCKTQNYTPGWKEFA